MTSAKAVVTPATANSGAVAPQDILDYSLDDLMRECNDILPGLHAADALMERSEFTERCDDLCYAKSHVVRTLRAVRDLYNHIDLAVSAEHRRQAAARGGAL